MNYKGYSEIGNREINEDNYGIALNNNRYCFVVADGLGGHGKGEVASLLATEAAIKYFYENPNIAMEEQIRGCFESSQKAVLDEIELNKSSAQYKTTMVIVLIDGNESLIGHIGDSRGYFIRKGKIKEVTQDHSVPQMLVNTREIKRKQMRNHPDRNRLLRVIGIDWATPKYEISKTIQLKKNDAFLLCSDGVWECFDEDELASIVQKNESQKAIDNIRDSIMELDREDKDNNTAIVIKV